MPMRSTLAAIALGAVALCAGQAHAAPIVQNGGFEADAAPSLTITAWTTGGGNVFVNNANPHNGLNEADLTVAFNDVDFCLRVREAGYRNVWTPFAELYHHESATRGTEDNPEKVARFGREVEYMQTRWGYTLNYDPAYSPNLALDRTDFSLAWPPRIEPLPRHAAPLDNKEMA